MQRHLCYEFDGKGVGLGQYVTKIWIWEHEFFSGKPICGRQNWRGGRLNAKVCSQICSKRSTMFESHVVTSVDFFSNLPLQKIIYCVTDQPLCYWPTIYKPIWKICPKFQVLSFHFLNVDELLDEHWAKICFFVSGLDIQHDQSENYNPASKKLVSR